MTLKISTIQLILMGLFGVELLQKEILLFVLLFGVVVLTSKNKRLKITHEFIVLTICFTASYVTSLLKGNATISPFYVIRTWLGPIMAYMIGYFFVNNKKNLLIKMIKVLAISYLIHGMLNLISTQTLSVSSRSVHNFWTGGITTATLQSTYFVMAVAVASYWLMFEIVKYKILGLLIIGINLWNSMATASRTPLYLTAIILVIGYMMRQYMSRNKKSFVHKTIKLLIGLICIVSLLVIVYNNDLFNVKTTFENSFLGVRMSGIENEDALSRPELWGETICNLIQYPFGYKADHYTHNMWLDLGRDVGIVPLILLALYSILVMKNLLKFIIKQGKEHKECLIVLFVYIGLMISFMLEPILQGVPFLFITFCMINGGVASIIKSC